MPSILGHDNEPQIAPCWEKRVGGWCYIKCYECSSRVKRCYIWINLLTIYPHTHTTHTHIFERGQKDTSTLILGGVQHTKKHRPWIIGGKSRFQSLIMIQSYDLGQKHSWAVAAAWQFAISMCAVKFNLLLMLSLCAFMLSHSWPVKSLQEEFRLSWAALNASRWRESPTTASCGPHSLPLIHHPSIAESILPFAQLSCSSNGVIHKVDSM